MNAHVLEKKVGVGKVTSMARVMGSGSSLPDMFAWGPGLSFMMEPA